MNTTKGIWHAEPYEHDEGRTGFMVIANGAHHSVADLGPLPEAEDNARLIALCGNENQKYKLESFGTAIEQLRKDWETKHADDLVNAVNNFLQTVTR